MGWNDVERNGVDLHHASIHDTQIPYLIINIGLKPDPPGRAAATSP